MSFFKLKFIFITLLFLGSLSSCEQMKKEKTANTQSNTEEIAYSIEPKTTTVFWTGYKTTAKTPVQGRFTKITISNLKEAKKPQDAIDGLAFSIPVSSLFSDDTSRDSKLKEFFFGVMDNTELISGTLNIVNDSLAHANLKMNGVSKTLPLSYFIAGQMLSMKGTLNINDWNGQKALASLHQVCEEKHTGKDGISKTWEEVEINIQSYLKVK